MTIIISWYFSLRVCICYVFLCVYVFHTDLSNTMYIINESNSPPHVIDPLSKSHEMCNIDGYVLHMIQFVHYSSIGHVYFNVSNRNVCLVMFVNIPMVSLRFTSTIALYQISYNTLFTVYLSIKKCYSFPFCGRVYALVSCDFCHAKMQWSAADEWWSLPLCSKVFLRARSPRATSEPTRTS